MALSEIPGFFDNAFTAVDKERYLRKKFLEGELIRIQRRCDELEKKEKMNPCKVKDCGKTDDQKPMVFRGEDYCSDLHRKVLSGELKEE